mgnify:CR=1 FL=1
MNKIKNWTTKLLIPTATVLAGLNVFAQQTFTPPGSISNITPVTGLTGQTAFTKVATIINYFLAVVSVVATIMIIYGGFLYVTAGANEDNTKKAKSMLLYGIIGLVIAGVAFSIVSFANSLLV